VIGSECGWGLRTDFQFSRGPQIIKQMEQVDEICVDFDVVHLTDNFDLEIHIQMFPTSLSPNEDYRHHLDPMYLYGFLSEQNVPHTDFRGLRANFRVQTQNLVSFQGLCRGGSHPYNGGTASSGFQIRRSF